MDKIIKSLVSLGLNEKEAKIYMALYKLGEVTSYQIAKESGVKRPTVYLIMEELRKKGLVLIVPHVKKQLYTARDPHEFIREYQEKVNKEGYNLLVSLPKVTHPSTTTLIFKGEGALEQGLAYGLNSFKGSEMIAFYTAIDSNTHINTSYINHFNNLHLLGFKLRSIIPSNSQDKTFRDQDLKYGFENKKISSPIFSPSISIEIFGNLVKTIFHKKKEVMVVEDKGLSDFYRQIFSLYWSI